MTARRSLGCARCGDCCERIVLDVDPRDPRWDVLPPENDARRSAVFIRAHWTATGERLAGGGSVWVCDRFDPETRTCAAHDQRPPVCEGYPWYGRAPEPQRIAHGRCSFLLDVPAADRPAGARPLIPVTDVTEAGR